MVVQAEAARNLLTLEPADAEAAIRAIEQTGRDALAQLQMAYAREVQSAAPPATLPRADRVATLEAEVAQLRQELEDLKQQFARFQKQFE